MEREKSVARDLFRREIEALSEIEREIVGKIVRRESVSRPPSQFDDDRTFGQIVADRVASFGGSWTFIGIFAGIMIVWVVVNSYILAARPFDPFPYILLNLFLSMLAALQAPVIMMSQNRQAAKDRDAAEHDYEINLKAEMEIIALHQKLDQLREAQWSALIELQQKQISLLEQLASTRHDASGSTKTDNA